MDKRILYAPAAVALLAMLPLPIGFYTFVRIVICGFASWVAYTEYQNGNKFWLLFGGIAVLFNPIIPVYLYDKAIWTILDLLTAGAFFWKAKFDS